MQGDVIVFDQFYEDLGSGVHDFANDTFAIGLIDASVTPAAADADPRWGNAGSTDFSTAEVTPGGNYTTGGPSIGSTTWGLSSGESVFDGATVTVSQDASNPTDARWGIIYNSTAAGKNAIGAIDLGGARDLSATDLEFDWHVDGIIIVGASS